MNVLDKLERLNNLKEKGAISENEFQELKTSILNNKEEKENIEKEIIDKKISDEKLWSVFIHISQLASFIIPFSGLVLPIVLWQIKKNESEFIDINGIIVTNWIISKIIYYAISIFLCFVIIGIPLLWGLAMISIIFPAIGAVIAGSGKVWRYPLSISFIKITRDEKNIITQNQGN